MTSDPLAAVRLAVAAAKANPAAVPAARAALPAVLAEVEAPVFHRELRPATADTVAQYQALISRPSPPRFLPTMADVHERALVVNEPLSEACRAREMLDDIAAAGTHQVFPDDGESLSDAYQRASATAVRTYKMLVAKSIAAIADHPLRAAAARMLEVLALQDDLAAAIADHEAHDRAAAAQAEAERRAAQEAADRQADQLEAKGLFVERARQHGLLPENVTSGPFYEQQMARCLLLAEAKRRLRCSPVDAIRMDRGTGRGLFGTRDLVGAINECSADELRALLNQLDRAEGREVVS